MPTLGAGETGRVKCLAGHAATGVTELTCREDGTWSGGTGTLECVEYGRFYSSRIRFTELNPGI